MSLLHRSPEDEADEGDGDILQDASWLYSFADLMTQLLLFSILTVTLTGIAQADQAEEQMAGLSGAARELQQLIKKRGLEDSMAIDLSADRVVIRLESNVLFDPGKALLTAGAVDVLGDLVRLLGQLGNDLRVEGHTDDVPIRTPQFPSNWELSSARAISVVQYMEQHGVESGRLSAAGYGEFHPIAANDSATNRATNRRVEIVILGDTQK